MKPPKRPAPDRTPSFEERPRKIVRLRVNSASLQDIQSKPQNPTLYHRAKSSSTKSASPSSRQSPGARSSITPSPSSTLSNGTITAVPASAPAVSATSTPMKVRKPLPDGSARTPLPEKVEKPARKPLPDSTSSGRKPLPSAPPTPSAEPVAAAPPRQKLLIKFNLKKAAAGIPPQDPSL
ncbi:uncharacterized protein LY89DRAFT_679500 [Mollisia scopiformis]|uniref:Uncharacterized protein n=1 Tax=Mollisia scopiformis TaxID=149040 RepID=A0A194XVU0_MOLSC|nr:uncharacterized protein LY89DRAFT_679500 [Mollisia scopiformis]KUJ24343.1 hypothetical protein LY89DRAFT_679500 [Mollisia scopiformis]